MRQVHQPCGTREEEWITWETWTDDQGRDHREPKEIDPPPYIAVGTVCYACREVGRVRRELEEAYSKMPGEGDGVSVVLQRNPMLTESVPSTAEGAE